MGRVWKPTATSTARSCAGEGGAEGSNEGRVLSTMGAGSHWSASGSRCGKTKSGAEGFRLHRAMSDGRNGAAQDVRFSLLLALVAHCCEESA